MARTARPDLVGRYAPQLAQLVAAPPSGSDWLHELKLDGYRAGAAKRDGDVRLVSRRRRDLTPEFPELAQALRSVAARDALLDGEIVMLDAQGRTDFQALQNRATSRAGLAYFVFDLLWLDGQDVTALPLERRKELLRGAIEGAGPAIHFSEHFDVDGAEMYVHACRLGAEGIISKRRRARYATGVRTEAWRKSKCNLRRDFVVGGFTEPTHATRGVGSLLLGHHVAGKLVFAGKVSRIRGFGASSLVRLRARLDELARPDAPFDPPPSGWLGRNARWVEPTIVADVTFSEWTRTGNVRHATIEELRDRPPERDKVIFPSVGLARSDLVRFYEDIHVWAMPHIERRPLTLVRCDRPITRDDALRTACKFLRHTRASQPGFAGVPRIDIPEQKKVGEYLYVDSPATLRSIIASGVIELHVWNARVDDVEHPDRVVFDLDPGDGATWQQVIDAARRLRAHLAALELEAWPRTTGGKGLHVVVPFRRGPTWDEAYAWSKEVAEALAAGDRGLTTAFEKHHRTGKILVDYKRNYRGAIAVAGFSIRARPAAPVAVPIAWREVTSRLRPDQWTVTNLRDRLARLRSDPWAGYASCTQALTPVLARRLQP
ncbi:MAG: non-homologous end-joining DNA ligase [Deltaproteobacteria bacterium]|nr:non-homologous end-joining DNA ligase [Kofleriaceae bacterium]